MKPRLLISLVVLAGIGAAFWYAMRAPRGDAAPPPTANAAAPPSALPARVASAVLPAADVTPAVVAPAMVERWITDANGADARKRADAIAALAQAPKSQALPALRRILENGEPVDRPLALRSLRDLALEQGDADGAIRAVVREAMYHGDDYTAMADVQETLDVIEESEMR